MKHVTLLLVMFCGVAAAQKNSPRTPSDYDRRVSDLERRNAETPGDPKVLEALAGSYAMGARYSDAIRITRELSSLLPGNAIYRLRLANLYAWSGDVDRAIEEVRWLGERGGPDAIELECRLLTWKRSAPDAAACYARLRQVAAPGSAQQLNAELGLARNLVWSGQAGPAVRAYREYTTSSPGDSTAVLEFARLLSYRGRYVEAERVVSALLLSEPDNAIALSLKAEILHWAGHRPREAAALSADAIALQPDLPGARVAAVYARKDLGDLQGAREIFRDLQDRVQAAGFDGQAPYAGGYEYLRERVPEWGKVQVQIPFSGYNDSDGIHQTFRGARVALPVGNDTLSFNARQYATSAPAQSPFSFEGEAQHVGVFSAGATLHISPNIQVESSAGIASFARGSSQGVFSIGLSGSPVDRWVFQLGAARNIVPVTPRSIGIGLASTGFQGGADYYFDSRTFVGAQAERGLWNDGNKSIAGDLHLQRVLRHSNTFAVDAGSRVRLLTFARDMTSSSGIFTPDLYQCYEGFVKLHGGVGKRLAYDIQPASGAQRIASSANFRPSWEITSSVKLNLAGSWALSASYQRRNYNLVSGSGYYQGFYLQLGLQP